MTTTSAQSNPPADPDFRPGLEGVIAFESEIAEPDKEGGALRYRGVDINDLVGRVSFGQVWGLLVDNEFGEGLPPADRVIGPWSQVRSKCEDFFARHGIGAAP